MIKIFLIHFAVLFLLSALSLLACVFAEAREHYRIRHSLKLMYRANEKRVRL